MRPRTCFKTLCLDYYSLATMTDVDLRADALVGSNTFSGAINCDMHLPLDASGSQSSTGSTSLSCSHQRMTAQKLQELERADVKVHDLVSQLTLEEKVSSVLQHLTPPLLSRFFSTSFISTSRAVIVWHTKSSRKQSTISLRCSWLVWCRYHAPLQMSSQRGLCGRHSTGKHATSALST